MCVSVWFRVVNRVVGSLMWRQWWRLTGCVRVWCVWFFCRLPILSKSIPRTQNWNWTCIFKRNKKHYHNWWKRSFIGHHQQNGPLSYWAPLILVFRCLQFTLSFTMFGACELSLSGFLSFSLYLRIRSPTHRYVYGSLDCLFVATAVTADVVVVVSRRTATYTYMCLCEFVSACRRVYVCLSVCVCVCAFSPLQNFRVEDFASRTVCCVVCLTVLCICQCIELYEWFSVSAIFALSRSCRNEYFKNERIHQCQNWQCICVILCVILAAFKEIFRAVMKKVSLVCHRKPEW